MEKIIQKKGKDIPQEDWDVMFKPKEKKKDGTDQEGEKLSIK